MREIKFRAWDGTQMIYDGDKIYPSFFTDVLKSVCSPLVVTNRDVYFYIYESKLEFSDDSYFDHISYLLVKEIMQFTGLKDKNGKEIYEGDILFCSYPEYIEERRKIYEICWDDLNEEIGLRRKKAIQGADFPAREDGYVYQGRPVIHEFSRIYEIIGNIYENPELLKL